MRFARHIPNLLTLTNLFLGCLAIVYILQDFIIISLTDESGDGVRYISALGLGNLPIACILVLVAAVIDLFDGALARLLKVESRMGAQLDSLADVVTFGVVPGLIMYHLLAISWFASDNPFDTPVLAFVPAFVITLAAAWRLARFNVSAHTGENAHTAFRGLPTPASAIVIVSLPLAAHLSEGGFDQWITNKWIMYGITLLLSVLMVSKLPMAKIGSGHATWFFAGTCVVILGVGYFVFDLLFSLIPMLVMLYVLYSLVMSSTGSKSSIANPTS